MALRAHVDFTITANENVGPQVLSHFSKLGYRLINESSNKWTFQRGSKASTFWRFDIRAYATTLDVRAISQETGELWISCDWEVWTFMTIATGADISTLEAEAHQLESVLRESS